MGCYQPGIFCQAIWENIRNGCKKNDLETTWRCVFVVFVVVVVVGHAESPQAESE